MNDKLAAKIAKVQALLNTADDFDRMAREGDGDPNERRAAAANYRETAERIMREYRIEEEQLIASDPSEAEVQIHSLMLCKYNSEFWSHYGAILRTIARYAGVQVVGRWSRDGEEDGNWVDLFGYEGDLRMAEWLWSSARLVFGSHLEPRIDPNASDQVNAYNLRQAGMLRKDVARALWNDNTPALRSKAQRLYEAECRARGVEPSLKGLGTDAETYRAGYADSFISRLRDRLKAASDAADSVGGALVLHGRADRVKETMYAVYPHLRPKPVTEVAQVVVDNTPAKVDRRRKDWTQADERRWQRRNNASAQAGWAAGREAASKVEVNPTHTPAKRLDTPHTALEG